MGVDYTANKGIGFRINVDDNEDIDEFLENLLENKQGQFSYFKVGDEYCDDEIEWFIVLEDDSLDDNLYDRCEELKSFLLVNGLIDINDSVSVVGGLRVH
ncbi:hypothetical protein FCL53_10625 [Elizabethkingia meningoseptica]|uniref:hypothetical protein n=1 Tax=Elizabethkingia meningoseptica TaxID=238 RepID=UPI00136521D3|nr:hypothetical protein [Elizabethkingia meningoseptica]MVW92419.1 hypothetical protein [Elizabethkingia meningoseptica]